MCLVGGLFLSFFLWPGQISREGPLKDLVKSNICSRYTCGQLLCHTSHCYESQNQNDRMILFRTDLKDHLVLSPLQWRDTRLGCSEPHPTWPTLPGMGHPQILKAILCFLKTTENGLTSPWEKQVITSSTLGLLLLLDKKSAVNLKRRNCQPHSRFTLSRVLLCVSVTQRQHRIFSGTIPLSILDCKYKPRVDVLPASCSAFTLWTTRQWGDHVQTCHQLPVCCHEIKM